MKIEEINKRQVLSIEDVTKLLNLQLPDIQKLQTFVISVIVEPSNKPKEEVEVFTHDTVLRFGKHIGKRLGDVQEDISYWRWMQKEDKLFPALKRYVETYILN